MSPESVVKRRRLVAGLASVAVLPAFVTAPATNAVPGASAEGLVNTTTANDQV
jgi:hypothetical protein